MLLTAGFLAACSAPRDPLADAASERDAVDVPRPSPTSRLDLLLVIDNSNSMRENQSTLLSALPTLLQSITRDGAVQDIQVGVIDTDLGTPGATVPGCADSDVGDHGFLNPIRYGRAMARHQPWGRAPAGFRPADCNRADEFPPFIGFRSDTSDPSRFDHDLRCNALLYSGGCGLEQPLEAVWRALVLHDARAPIGRAPNGGFVRDDALLAIVLLTDEEDGSVRDCRFARGAACDDATEVFQVNSLRWSAANLNLRFYTYTPGASQDPTWSLDRYVHPRDAARGLFALKPGHPERVLFAAITGVPLPARGTDPRAAPDWDRLLGTPRNGDADDFDHRDASSAIDEPSTEGPVSMRGANLDALCPERVVPACRREGSTLVPPPNGCNPTEQYFAWPARRIVEVARRFDASALCGGRACHNGFVGSICASSYEAPLAGLAARIVERARGN